MTTTCLVTGGAGFIGTALSAQLADRYDAVVAVDSLHPQVHPDGRRPSALDGRVQLVEGDVTVAQTWDDVLAVFRPDTVVHLAAETGIGQSLTEATRHACVNVVGTAQMLDAFVRHECLPTRIVLTSSRAVYGEGAWAREDGAVVYPGQRSRAQLDAGAWAWRGLRPLPHDSVSVEPRPTSVYGATKLAQEHVLTAWCLAMGVTPILVRLQNVYGPGQSPNNPYTGIVPLFAQVARGGGSIPVYEDGEIVRDFVFIDDVVAALLGVLAAGKATASPYDVGSGKGTTILDLARIVAGIYGAPEPTITGQFRDGDVRHASAAIERTEAAADWHPTVPVEVGVARLCAWIDGSGR